MNQPTEPIDSPASASFEWRTLSFPLHQRHQWWFPIFALVTVALFGLTMVAGEYLIGCIVVVGAYVLYELANREPEKLSVKISDEGVQIGDRIIGYSDLRRFWLIETPDHHLLHLEPQARLGWPITIPYEAEDRLAIQEALRHHLDQDHEAKEDLADRINRWLKL
ncbi:MAG: Uncharacterized protein CEO22_215 [Candidatus Berkelbacteria bacterium Gr01-1014_85]|uniref:DUF5673 domain-containing protein n=1 Tax=Candidatus Berkelbacteria bacterium Gr01-1014_85 TaxID=2017150 RepID=A0A554JCL6_9BACT|nr:MAG: Uncharacterized protein CEO22_215 [Candidatus Berkelbacteria bacterium Gr01-1014_85]